MYVLFHMHCKSLDEPHKNSLCVYEKIMSLCPSVLLSDVIVKIHGMVLSMLEY